MKRKVNNIQTEGWYKQSDENSKKECQGNAKDIKHYKTNEECLWWASQWLVMTKKK